MERQARAVAGRERRPPAHGHPRRPGGRRPPGGHERRRMYDGVTDQNIKWADNDARRPARRPGVVHPAALVERRQVEHDRIALDAVPRRREGRRARLAGLADVQLRRLELGLHRHPRLAARLPRRRDVPEDPPSAAGAARPAAQLGEPVRLLRHRRRRPDRDGDALAGPAAAGRQGPGAALGRPERGLRHVRRRQRLREGQRDRLRHVAARRGRSRCAVPGDGHEVPGPARQPEVRRRASSGATGGRSTN